MLRAAQQLVQCRPAHIAVDQQHPAALVPGKGDGQVGSNEALALLRQGARYKNGLECAQVAKLLHARTQAAELLHRAAAFLERGKLLHQGVPGVMADLAKIEFRRVAGGAGSGGEGDLAVGKDVAEPGVGQCGSQRSFAAAGIHPRRGLGVEQGGRSVGSGTRRGWAGALGPL